MKGNSKIKQTTVLLIAYVLVVGFVGLGGQVYGDTGDPTQETDVVLEVQEFTVDLYIDPAGELGDEYETVPENIVYNEDVLVSAVIQEAPGQEDAVDSVELEFQYEGDGRAGEADDGQIVTIQGTDVDWTYGEDDQGHVENTFSPEDPGTDEFFMWRYGATGEWEITATGYGHEDNGDAYSDDDTGNTNVQEYRNIDPAEDGEASGAPGEILEGADFIVPGTETQPTITITANSNWGMDEAGASDFTLALEVDETVTITSDDTSVSYDSPADQIPTYDETFNIDYWVHIPAGQEAGSYSTAHDGGDSVTHTVENTET